MTIEIAIAIATSAFGADEVRQTGQTAWLPLIASAGASHVEIRAELFSDAAPDLAELGAAVGRARLGCLYSAPLELWPTPDGPLSPEIAVALQQAQTLGADALKVSLGHFGAATDLAPLARLLDEHPTAPRLLVENDQTIQGGRLAPLRVFITASHAAELPIDLTFDVGNWHWQAEDPLTAAQALGERVAYVHLKAVRHHSSGLRAVAPEASDLEAWRRLFACFAPTVRRAIEFPLSGADVADEARRQVQALRTLTHEVPSHV